MMSWKSFSQSGTNSKTIQLTKPIAKLVIKDLIQFDGLSEEMQTMQIILSETNEKLITQGNLVANLRTQVSNYQKIINEKDTQLSTSKELSKSLEKELKRQARQKKLFQFGTITVGAAALLLAL